MFTFANNFVFKPRIVRLLVENYLGMTLSNPSFYTWVEWVRREYAFEKKKYTVKFVKLLCAAAITRKQDLESGISRNGARHNHKRIWDTALSISDQELQLRATELLLKNDAGEVIYKGSDFAHILKLKYDISCHINSFYDWSKQNPHLPTFDKKRSYNQEEFDQWVHFLKNKPGRKYFQKKTVANTEKVS